ncbi:beta-ketoacyl-[acyl-carrier-protein] synthase family protein [Telmatocola sphagniphila]|uniref:3-oxoacyl-[acyl-carrier-protein] synthase 2 n=1 Tax=Telmatocola sphagniphila TaxID=1123043 RepID=A0A8E6B244_9BACT|nr:beta-ketoacyl-[acyl-carrier-protein] synthase family protein [Telmatocola sphagniphila]QVL30417.1 beta-ketoacyl-[acyl-carrier-protein] synthase family protein [Telmatocola sphagniphila]
MRRVVVTGLGVVAPNGIGREEFWSSCVAGRSGISTISAFDSKTFPINVAGEVKQFDATPFVPESSRKSLKIMGRAAKFGLGAAGLALQDSGIDMRTEDPGMVGVVMGTGLVPIDMSEIMPLLRKVMNEEGHFDLTKLDAGGGSPIFPLWLLKYLPNMVAAHISMAFNAQGPNSTITTACVAGTQAVGEGFRMISRGEADVCLAGGADSRLDPLLLMAYTALGTLSRRTDLPPEQISRPFDRLRDGFVLGEGSGVLVLEDFDRARKRGAKIYAEILGFGSSFDAYSITKPDPEGKGGARAIRNALNEAKVSTEDVRYINAHGTSTRLNDCMETNAVKHAFGEHKARMVPISSIKSMIGHSIGASGAIEAVALALTLSESVTPPTINLTHPDPVCDLDYIPNVARDWAPAVAISTSFGFGGQNGALVMRAM